MKKIPFIACLCLLNNLCINAQTNYFPPSGNVGIGTTSPVAKLHLNHLSYTSDQIFDPLTNLLIENTSNAWRTATGVRFKNYKGSFTIGMYGENDISNNSFRIYHGENLSLIINSLGNMGLGVRYPGSWRLAVDGQIRAKEIKVETNWSDFVFAKDYNLPTLKEVEEHIKEKGHLKDIPSEEDVKENGIFLGEMDSKLLQKIEELTLYAIDQHKEIEIQKNKIEKLEKENEELKSISKRLQDIETLLNYKNK